MSTTCKKLNVLFRESNKDAYVRYLLSIVNCEIPSNCVQGSSCLKTLDSGEDYNIMTQSISFGELSSVSTPDTIRAMLSIQECRLALTKRMAQLAVDWQQDYFTRDVKSPSDLPTNVVRWNLLVVSHLPDCEEAALVHEGLLRELTSCILQHVSCDLRTQVNAPLHHKRKVKEIDLIFGCSLTNSKLTNSHLKIVGQRRFAHKNESGPPGDEWLVYGTE